MASHPDPQSEGRQEKVPRIPDGTLIDNRYQVQHRMGIGGFGEIYRVCDTVLERDLVLKVPHAELARVEAFRHAFLREARLAMELRSPDTVAIRDAGQVGALPYFTMDLVPGEDLRFLLRRERRLAPERALRLATQLLDVLSRAHERGIVHRDLKPANIMVVPGGERIVLLDFGIARILSAAAGALPVAGGGGTLSQGRVVGSPQYMSPEHAAGDPVDARSDLYAVGILLFEMITGRPPFLAATAGQVLMKQMTEEPPRLGEVEPSLRELPRLELAVRRALAKDPADRFEDAASFRRELESILERGVEAPAQIAVAADEGPASAQPAAPASERHRRPASTPGRKRARSARRRRRQRRVLAARAAFMLILIGGAAAMFFPALWADLQRGLSALRPGAGLGTAEFFLLTSDRCFVREDHLTVRGRMAMGHSAGIVVECGDQCVEPDLRGEFEFVVAVDSAERRRIGIRARAPNGETFQDFIVVARDATAPVIRRIEPRDGRRLERPEFHLRIEVEDASPGIVAVHPAGRPEHSIELDRIEGFDRVTYSGTVREERGGPRLFTSGKNTFVVRAIDQARNTQELNFDVFYSGPRTERRTGDPPAGDER